MLQASDDIMLICYSCCVFWHILVLQLTS